MHLGMLRFPFISLSLTRNAHGPGDGFEGWWVAAGRWIDVWRPGTWQADGSRSAFGA